MNIFKTYFFIFLILVLKYFSLKNENKLNDINVLNFCISLNTSYKEKNITSFYKKENHMSKIINNNHINSNEINKNDKAKHTKNKINSKNIIKKKCSFFINYIYFKNCNSNKKENLSNKKYYKLTNYYIFIPKLHNINTNKRIYNYKNDKNFSDNVKNEIKYKTDKNEYINKIIDDINDYINLEIYKEKYGNEIYNEIINLYVKRDIPINYEEKYFKEKIKKSIVFDINKYDDKEFEKLLELEFQKNGIFINKIDKKYYNKLNISRLKNLLEYLPLFKLINNPDDLKKLKNEYLPLLEHELKLFTFFIVNITSGHFSSVLGLLELQILILYIFNLPYDHVMYDVGHQTYIHKFLTGRKFLSFSLRKLKGISGFFDASESVYDIFGNGHSSTSMSVIQGLYEGKKKLIEFKQNNEHSEQNNENYKQKNYINDKLFFKDRFFISIIGDGGLTSGLALEALNYISFLKSKVLIIYNQNNEISLPTNVSSVSGNKPIGSIAEHLNDFIIKKKKNENFDKNNEKNIFETLNYKYIGPIDGNNINELYDVLLNIKNNNIQEPTFIHIITKKSNEYIDKKSPINKMHSIKKNEIFNFNIHELDNINMNNENIDKNKNTIESENIVENKNTVENVNIVKNENIFENIILTDFFTEEMLNKLKKDKKIIFVSAAMLGGTGLVKIANLYPNNVYDVGIAEQHSVTFSSSLALYKDLKVYLLIYSTFLQRAYDQIIHDLNMHNIPLNVIICRTGLIGEDGPTHQGLYDLNFLGSLNNAHIISPSNQIDFKRALDYSYINNDKTLYIRMPKIKIFKENYIKNVLNIKENELENLDDFYGKARIIKMSIDNNVKNISLINNEDDLQINNITRFKKKVCIFNMGYMLHHIINAINEIENDSFFNNFFSFSIIDMIFLNPMDTNIIDFVIQKNKHDFLITFEDNIKNGFSSHFNSYLIQKDYIYTHKLSVYNIHLPNDPIISGSYEDQITYTKMDKENLSLRIKNYLKKFIK